LKKDIRVKVISDGTVPGTKVFNVRTGEKIEGVQRIDFSVDAQNNSHLAPLILTINTYDVVIVPKKTVKKRVNIVRRKFRGRWILWRRRLIETS